MATYPEIGNAIREHVDIHDLKYSHIAERTYKRMGYGSPGTAIGFIQNVKRGAIYGTHSAWGWKNPKGLQRLSIFLEALGLEKDHPIISMVRAVTEDEGMKSCGAKDFVFPPPKELTLEKIVD